MFGRIPRGKGTRRAFLAAAAGVRGAAAGRRPPNIIFIWGDNLAYQDLGVYGNPRARTRVLDALAGSGVRFTQFYVAHVVCSPSRAGLLTGRQPFRTGIVHVLRPDSPSGIPPDEITLGEALREAGYATMAVGKWHLGDRKAYLPTQHGFDRYFGLPYSMDMLPTHLYRDNEIIDDLAGDKVRTLTERYAEAAIRFVEDNRARPFFLYFSHSLPHQPLNIPARARAPGRTLYEDAITHLDEQTGRVLEAVDRLGLRENTLVIFSSDNGPQSHGGETGVLRGGITTAFEGGLRVPFVASWPGTLPQGRVVETPAIAYDVFPTLLRLAGGSLRGDRVYDGQDIWPLLSGEGSFQRRAPFIWVYLDNVTTIRDGRWKLHVGHQEKPLPKPELYDVEADPGERTPLGEARPEVAARLKARIAEFQQQVPKAWRLDYVVRDPAKLKSGRRKQ
jgi:arylsulfatase A-like enzyme